MNRQPTLIAPVLVIACTLIALGGIATGFASAEESPSGAPDAPTVSPLAATTGAGGTVGPADGDPGSVPGTPAPAANATVEPTTPDVTVAPVR